MAVGIGVAAVIGDAGAIAQPVDLAMVGANAVAAVVEQPVAVRTADAAAVQGKTVGGLAAVKQLRGVADDQRKVHARPLIRTTAG